jgi:hypothetical protein
VHVDLDVVDDDADKNGSAQIELVSYGFLRRTCGSPISLRSQDDLARRAIAKIGREMIESILPVHPKQRISTPPDHLNGDGRRGLEVHPEGSELSNCPCRSDRWSTETCHRDNYRS